MTFAAWPRPRALVFLALLSGVLSLVAAALAAEGADSDHKAKASIGGKKNSEGAASGTELIDCTKEPEEKYANLRCAKVFTLDNPSFVDFLRKENGARSSNPSAASYRTCNDNLRKYVATHDPASCFPAKKNFRFESCQLMGRYENARIIPDSAHANVEIYVLDDAYRVNKVARSYNYIRLTGSGFASAAVDIRHQNGEDVGTVLYHPDLPKYRQQDLDGKPKSFFFTEGYVNDGSVELAGSEIAKCFRSDAEPGIVAVRDKSAAYSARTTPVLQLGSNGAESFCGDTPERIIGLAKQNQGFDPDKSVLDGKERLGIVASGANQGFRKGAVNVLNSAAGICESAKGLYNLARNRPVPDPENPPDTIGMFNLLKRSFNAELGEAVERCFQSACASYPEKECSPLAYVNTTTCSVALLGKKFGEKAVTELVEKIKRCASDADEASKCFADLGVASATTALGLGATKGVTALSARATTALSTSALDAGTKTVLQLANRSAAGLTNAAVDATLNQSPVDLDHVGRPLAKNPARARNSVPVLVEPTQKKFYTAEASARELRSALDNGGLTVAIGDFHVGRSAGGASRQVGVSEYRQSVEALGNFLEENKGKVSRVQITGDVVDAPGLASSAGRYKTVSERNAGKIKPDGSARDYRGLSPERTREKVQQQTFEQAFAQIARGAPEGKAIKVDLFYGNHDGAALRALDLKAPNGSPLNVKLERGRVAGPAAVKGGDGSVKAEFDPATRQAVEAVFTQRFGNDPARARKLVDDYSAEVTANFSQVRSDAKFVADFTRRGGRAPGDDDFFREAVKRAQGDSPEFGFSFADPAAVKNYAELAKKAAAKYGGKIEVEIRTAQDFDLAYTDLEGGARQLAGHNPVTFQGVSSPNRENSQYLKGQQADPRLDRRPLPDDNFNVVQNSDKHDPHLTVNRDLNNAENAFYGVSTPVFGAGVRTRNQPASGLVIYGTVDRDGKKLLRPFYLEAAGSGGQRTLIQSDYQIKDDYVVPTRTGPNPASAP